MDLYDSVPTALLLRMVKTAEKFPTTVIPPKPFVKECRSLS